MTATPDMEYVIGIQKPWPELLVSGLLLRTVPELTGPGVRVGQVRSLDGRGFSERVAAPTRLSCPGFSRG